jgi:hypothetical protein
MRRSTAWIESRSNRTTPWMTNTAYSKSYWKLAQCGAQGANSDSRRERQQPLFGRHRDERRQPSSMDEVMEAMFEWLSRHARLWFCAGIGTASQEAGFTTVLVLYFYSSVVCGNELQNL